MTPREVATLDARFSMTIDGVDAEGEGVLAVLDPATASIIAEVPACGRAQLDAAVDAARRAGPSWRQAGIEVRRKTLLAIGDVLMSHIAPLSRLLTLEQGKPLDDATSEIAGAAFWCREIATLEMPETVNEDGRVRRSITRRAPLGVVGAIVPWNFPVILAMFKVAPALLAGNTVVLKPAVTTPLTTLRIGELLRAALPPGVLNVVAGADALGAWMTAHPGIDKISFTGSTETGRRVMESAARDLKRVTLELGGNDAAIVLPDVDVDKVAPELFWAAFRNSGQVCIATKRLYVHADIYQPMLKALCAYAATVEMGPGSSPGVRLGPVQNERQFNRVRALLQGAREAGLKTITPRRERPDGGYFIPVTFVANPPDLSPIVEEEQFGPVLPVLMYTDIEDAIARANASPYGLGASVWGRDASLARAVADRLEAGTVWINEAQHLSPHAPFAGHKQSGIGVENGLAGLHEFTAVQTLVERHAAPGEQGR